MSLRSRLRYMNPYDMHKALINEYYLTHPKDTEKFERDTSHDRTDLDVLRANHKFLWDDSAAPQSWEEEFAKKYYDKLFKEYCLADLLYYKENKIALRWRIEREVVDGKGQFECGNKRCVAKADLKTWEVNFAYMEHGERKNALVKIRLCPECSIKINYNSQKKEVKRLKRKSKGAKEPPKKKARKSEEKKPEPEVEQKEAPEDAEAPWTSHKPIENKSREEEMEDYLQDLLL